MATSGTIKSSNATGFTNCPRHIAVTWSIKSDPATNKSKFSWSARAENYGSEWVKAGPIKVIVNGTTVLNVTSRIEMSANELLGSGELEITHNSDGNKTVSVSISAAIFSTSTNSTYRGTITLDKINRISTLSVSDGTLNEKQALTVTQYSATFTHTVKYSCGSASGTIVEKSSATNISFTPPLSLANQAPNGAKVTVAFEIETFNGSTSLGINKYTNTYTIPDSVVPTFSFTVEDSNGYFETYGKYIQSKSEIAVEITAEGAYGSTIKSYKTTLDGKTYTDASFVSNVLSKSGTLTLAITVTDSRGRTATASEDITVLAYTAPRISSMKVERCTSDGALSTAGGYLKVTFSASASSLDAKNIATYKVQYKKSTDTEYTEVKLTDYANVYNVSGKTYIFEADKNIVYDVKLIVTDAFDETDKTATGPTSLKLLSILKKRCGIAIGKICEIANAFEVDLISYFNKTVKMAQGSYVHYTVGESGVAGYANVAQIVCKSEYVNTPVVIHTLQRGTQKNTYSIQFASDSSTDPALESFVHVGNNPAYLVKTDASTWELYIKKTEKWDAVCVTQLENSYYLNDRIEITWKNGLVTDLPDGYVESITSEGYRKGNSITVDIRTAGYVTNSMKEVHFIVPLSKEIIAPTTVTAVSVDGFCLRQNNTYTHGSSATVYAKPSSYAAYIDDYGVRIVATFSTTTNAINNAPIAIHWSGTLTFS